MSVSLGHVGRSLEDMTLPVSQRTTTRDLNQQDFLKIMIEQLKGQNPLEGGDSSDFFNQMVQFQSLEAMQSMTKAITQLTEVSTLANGAALVGREVLARIPAHQGIPGALPGDMEQVVGTVASVTFGDSVTVHLTDGRSVPAARILAVG
jgi:flagellar hook assembly protein FlgD